MPLDELRSTLEAVHAWCDRRGIEFGCFPMHEVAAHPQAPDVIRLFAQHDRMPAPYQPFTTTGVPLATRDDWREVLEAVRMTGSNTVWMAIHGLAEEHDRQVGRSGAFKETCTAVGRVHDVGMTVGCNVFVTNTNVDCASQIAEALIELAVEEQSWQPADYYPHARARRNEKLRPVVSDVLAIAGNIGAWSTLYREHWAAIKSWTEGAWVQRAMSGSWPRFESDVDFGLLLVLRPNLDLHFGRAGDYSERYGNLRRDGIDAVFEAALAAAERSVDEIWFRPTELLPIAEAARHGNPEGEGIHFSADSVRFLWLDRARRRDLPRQ